MVIVAQNMPNSSDSLPEIAKPVKAPQMSMIVAMSKNGVIGINNTLPWHLRDDLQNFKRVTQGKPIIMGRKTYDSIGRPLPGRSNIILSRQAALVIEGCETVSTIDQAAASAVITCKESGVDEYFVIGGAEVYSMCMPFVQQLYITVVDVVLDGDAWLPCINWDEWELFDSKNMVKSDQNDWDFDIMHLKRRSSV